MNRISAYLEEHDRCALTLVREKDGLWRARVTSPVYPYTAIIGVGKKPSAAITALENKLLMFAH